MMDNSPEIVICDLDQDNIDIEKSVFNAAGVSFERLYCKSQEDIIEQCGSATVLMVQYLKIDEEIFKALPTLKMVVRFGVGVDNINLNDANRYGVQVCNVPDYGKNEVADHAMALLTSLYRNVWILGQDTKQGNWNFKNGHIVRRPTSMRVGIVGTGRIGREFAKRCHAFGFNIIAFDPFYIEHTPENQRLPYISYINTFQELLEQSDILSLHCASTAENYHMMNDGTFSVMKEGSYFINVARGNLVDEKALDRALSSGKLAGAGIDVCEKEPIATDSPLLRQPNCIITPHTSWYSEEAAQQLKHDWAELAVAFVQGQTMDEKYKKNRINNR